MEKRSELLLLDELAFVAWPAAQVKLVDGWRLRSMRGYTRRGNSVWANAPLGALSFAERMTEVERFYREQGAAPIFQIAPDLTPAELDAQLAERGYLVDAPVSVQSIETEAVTARLRAEARVDVTMSDAWFSLSSEHGRFGGASDVYRGLLERIGSRARFALATAGGEPIGVALAVVEAGHMGIFAFHTLSTHRRAGVGESMLAVLARCAQDESVKTLYLQVERSNSAALALYARCGFRHRYGYHYRVAASTSSPG